MEIVNREPKEKPLDNLRVPMDKAMQIVNLLVEGVGIRATSRLAGVHQETVLAVLELVGQRCAKLLDSKVRSVEAKQVQIDEIWSFVQKKQKRVRLHESDLEIGDQYTSYSIDAESKLVINFYIGKRNGASAYRLLLGVFYDRFRSNRGIGVRVIQFLTASLVFPTLIILTLEQRIGQDAAASVIGTIVGYVLSGIGKDEPDKK